MNRITVETPNVKVIRAGLTSETIEEILCNPLVFGEETELEEIRNTSSDDTQGFLVSKIESIDEVRENTNNETILAIAEAIINTEAEYFEIR